MDDRAAIGEVVKTFFAAFTSGPGAGERLAGLRELFAPQAVVVRACGDPAVYDVDGFVAPRAELLTGGRLTGFREWPLDGRTEVFGDVAAHTCTYAKEGVLDGRPFTGRGFKSLHLVRLDGRWLITSVVWDDERDGLTTGPWVYGDHAHSIP
jgi:hypothetical protein